MDRVLAEGPPAGFRKAIPTAVKLDVVIRQEGKCKCCGERLGELRVTQFDHVPAIQLRRWDAEAEDTVPATNDPEHIEAKHTDCHAAKTFGSKSKQVSKRGADVTEIARTKRLAKEELAFRQRILAKGNDEEAEEASRPKPKSRWPKRSFPKRRRDAQEPAGGEEGS